MRLFLQATAGLVALAGYPAMADTPTEAAAPATAENAASPAQQDTVVEAVGIMRETVRHLQAVRAALQSLADTPSADAAAVVITAHTAQLKNLRRKSDDIMQQLQDDPELAERLVSTMQEVFGEDAEVLQLDDDLLRLCYLAKTATPPYYGSTELYNAIRGLVKILYDGDWDADRDDMQAAPLDDDQPPAPEQPSQESSRKVREAYLQLITLREELVEVIEGVHDKASADTAARRLEAQREKMGDILDQAEAEGYFHLLGQVMEEAPVGADVDRAFQLFLQRMRSMDPPYYGSEALEAFFEEEDGD